MQQTRFRHHTGVFCAVLAFCGCLNLIQYHFLDLIGCVLFCISFCLEFGLIAYWTQSALYRLLTSRARVHIGWASAMMLFLTLLRTLRYRIFCQSILLSRLLWYAYYIPLIMMPTLFLMHTISLYTAHNKRIPSEQYLLIPAGLLCILFMTNDLHLMAFRPSDGSGPEALIGDAYTYGWLMPACILWIVLCYGLGVVILLHLARTRRAWKRILPVLGTMALYGVLMLIFPVLNRRFGRLPFQIPDISVFCTIAFFEACIRLHLIPSNENYAGFFESMQLPVVITGPDLNPVYQTHQTIAADPVKARLALRHPLDIAPHMELQGMPIRSGFVFWVTDKRALHKLNQEITHVNEILAEENDLIRAENEVRMEKAQLDFRNRIYSRAERELRPAQRRVSGLIDTLRPDAPDFDAHLGRILALNAYIKRRTNMVLMENTQLSVRDLQLALEESARYLVYCGIQAQVTVTATRSYEQSLATALYDTFELVTESLFGTGGYLLISLSDQELRLLCEHPPVEPLPETPLSVRVETDEEACRIHIPVAGGDGP